MRGGLERRAAFEARQEPRDLDERFLRRVVEIRRSPEQAKQPAAHVRHELAQRVASRVRIVLAQSRGLDQIGNSNRIELMTPRFLSSPWPRKSNSTIGATENETALDAYSFDVAEAKPGESAGVVLRVVRGCRS